MDRFALLASLLVGCAPVGDAAVSLDEGDASPRAGKADTVDVPAGMKWVLASAEHRALAHQAYALATMRVEAFVAADSLAAGTWAVVLDADETTLNNVAHEREELEEEHDSFDAWVRRKEATAMPGAAAFMDRVHALGGKIAIVTNRGNAVCAATRENFTEVGLTPDIVLCRSGSGEKEARFRAVESGTRTGQPPLRVVLYVGDNIQDFPDLTQDIRFEDDEAFAPFGDRFVLLPNPMYGSWERNRIE